MEFHPSGGTQQSFEEKVTLSYTFLWQINGASSQTVSLNPYPFDIPSLELCIPYYNCCKYNAY